MNRTLDVSALDGVWQNHLPDHPDYHEIVLVKDGTFFASSTNGYHLNGRLILEGRIVKSAFSLYWVADDKVIFQGSHYAEGKWDKKKKTITGTSFHGTADKAQAVVRYVSKLVSTYPPAAGSVPAPAGADDSS